MPRTKGSKNKATLEKEAVAGIQKPTQMPIPVGNDVMEDNDSSDDSEGSDDLTNVRVLTKDGTWGYTSNGNRSYVVLLHRVFYKERTVGTKGRGAGKVYEAGTYGPWQVANALYPTTVARAKEIVAKAIFHDNLKESEELMSEAQAMQAAWDALVKANT